MTFGAGFRLHAFAVFMLIWALWDRPYLPSALEGWLLAVAVDVRETHGASRPENVGDTLPTHRQDFSEQTGACDPSWNSHRGADAAQPSKIWMARSRDRVGPGDGQGDWDRARPDRQRVGIGSGRRVQGRVIAAVALPVPRQAVHPCPRGGGREGGAARAHRSAAHG